jgi:hypothetical protein
MTICPSFELLIFVITLLCFDVQSVYSSMFIVVKSEIDGTTFPLACPLVQCLLWFVYMKDESMPWHIQEEEEEKCLDNEMALNLTNLIFVHLF